MRRTLGSPIARADVSLRLRGLAVTLASVVAACGAGHGTTDETASMGGISSPAPPAPAAPVEPAAPAPPVPSPPAPAAAAGRATLSWNAVDDSAVAGYRVYFGTAPSTYAQERGAGVDVGTTTRVELGGLQSGRRHFFAVTAYGADGSESAFSNEVSKLLE